LQSVYCQIAFRIFVYDDDSAEFHKGEFKDIAGSDAYLYQYYLHTPETGAGTDKEDKYRVTFLHRSFYQYFLSEFLYEKFKTITDVQSGKDFLKYLWARRLDNYVLDNFRYMAKGVNTACKCVLSAIEETDAILPTYENVSDSKERIGNYDKANNVFWNAVSACNRLFQIENSQDPLSLTGRIAELISRYDCFRISLELSSLVDANLQGAHLSFADLTRADLTAADLSFANLTRADLTGADLTRANLRRANLRRADLTGADLKRSDLSHADLRHADLKRSDLSYADLASANLTAADLTAAHLRRANLTAADLTAADLTAADLTRAYLIGADLTRANLRNADLRGADLIDVSLVGANLENAKVSRSQYDYISKQDVESLDKIIVVDDEYALFMR